VVLVAVDQLRGDLVESYDSLFTQGFRRLMDEGLRFTNATHDHARTATAAGHAALSTGAFPYRNGIVGNSWVERTPGGWRSVYSVEDTMVHILGHPAMEGRSPKNLFRTGLADWIVETDPGAVVVSLSRKDRAAVTMAGHAQGYVYWINADDAHFVTSSFYAADYPDWIQRFNRQEMPRIFGDSIWEATASEAARAMARPDSSIYEADGTHTTFPHRFTLEMDSLEEPGALNEWAYGKTHPDAAVGALAREAVRVLGMGQDEVTDYLGLSFSQTDAIGHRYGPRSQEQLENLLHLDRVLGELLTYLDEAVGPGRWVLALSGDHGVLDIPEHLAEAGGTGQRAAEEDLGVLRGIFAEYEEIEGEPLDVADALVASLEELPFIADALTVAELTGGPPADTFVTFLRNSYHPDRWIGGAGSRGSGVIFRFVEGFYADPDPHGTGHGSPYHYDRHVPLIFLGAGVEPGVVTDPVRTVDVAPTLAFLAGITTPADLDGVPLVR
jgi:predicted AlkP superfamily pyrophosphatase or phosphodiesterase